MQLVRSGFGGAPLKIATMVLALGSATTLAGCAGRGGPVPYNVQNFGAPDAPKADQFAQAYHVGPADVLSVSVYQVPNLSGDVEVDATGNITMPLIGAVPVQGKTNTEIATLLQERLGAKYLQSPEVQVTVKASPSQKFTVDGAVKQPGQFPVRGSISLIQAIAMANGTTEDANPRRVVVFRTIDGQRMAAAFDLKDIRRGVNPDPVIYASDIVVVDSQGAWRGPFRDVISTVPLLTFFTRF